MCLAVSTPTKNILVLEVYIEQQLCLNKNSREIRGSMKLCKLSTVEKTTRLRYRVFCWCYKLAGQLALWTIISAKGDLIVSDLLQCPMDHIHADKNAQRAITVRWYSDCVASFPGFPHFRSSVCVQYNTRRRKSAKKKTGKAGLIHHVSDIRWTR